jgi:hypothetical protein
VLRVSENINKSKHRRWSIFCIKQYNKAVYLSLHATNPIILRMQRIESSRCQRRSSAAGRQGRVPAMRMAAGRHVTLQAVGEAAWPTWAKRPLGPTLPGHMPAMGVAAPPCRHWPRRHVPRVACPGVPPLRRGLFWQKFSEVVFSDITLAQVVLCVKNSTSRSKKNLLP